MTASQSCSSGDAQTPISNMMKNISETQEAVIANLK